MLIAADTASVRTWLTAALSGDAYVLVETAASGEAPDADVVLLEACGQPQRTAQLIASLTTATTATLVISQFGMDEHVAAGLSAGAAGFLTVGAHPDTVTGVVRTAAAGASAGPPDVVRRLLTEFVHDSPGSGAAGRIDQLTAREAEVLRLAAQGLSNAEIAARLVVSTSTVKTHMNAILGKLKLRDRVQATIFAYEAGLVRPGLVPDLR